MTFRILLVQLAVFSLVKPAAFSQSLMPEIGRETVYRRSLELRNNLRVLNVAIKPGYEDLSALAYFHLVRGARVMTAYVSNGEAGESDGAVEYPPMLASRRRDEAHEAMALVGGEAHFICFPDIPSARDSLRIRDFWSHDSLAYRLMEVISQFKPNIILVSRDWQWGEKSLLTRILLDDLASAVREISDPNSAQRRGKRIFLPHWNVDRVFFDQPGKNGLTVPVDRRDSLFQKSYREIGEGAARSYRSLGRQREVWTGGPAHAHWPEYRRVFPGGRFTLKTLDAGVPAPASTRLRSLEREIYKITAAGLATRATDDSASGRPLKLLERVATLINTLNADIVRRIEFTLKEQNTLLQWKSGLENLRNSLLGVSVKYSISSTTVTNRQVITLRIDTVTGLSSTGTTEIYFPEVENGWVVNEDFPRRLPLKLHEAYRLLSPANLEYNIPAIRYGLSRSTRANPFTFFVLHRDSLGGRSFRYPVTVQFDYAPRFTSEALTPLVRVVDNEQVIVRLSNHTWDAVADTVIVADSVASSSPGVFHLESKGPTQVDTLTLRWKRGLPAGDYLIPLKIRKVQVGTFGARKFEVAADSTRRVGFLAGAENSPLKEALRRIGIHARAVDSESFRSAVDTLHAIIIDRRACSLRNDLPALSPILRHFVERGGHLIIMAQDEDAWNDTLLFPGLRLRRTFLFDERSPVWMDSNHRLLSYPNKLIDEDFNGWIFQRAYNSIAFRGDGDVAVPIKDRKTGYPLLLTKQMGKGNITYVDLALQPQLMNIHPGAFRILANLTSY